MSLISDEGLMFAKERAPAQNSAEGSDLIFSKVPDDMRPGDFMDFTAFL